MPDVPGYPGGDQRHAQWLHVLRRHRGTPDGALHRPGYALAHWLSWASEEPPQYADRGLLSRRVAVRGETRRLCESHAVNLARNCSPMWMSRLAREGSLSTCA